MFRTFKVLQKTTVLNEHEKKNSDLGFEIATLQSNPNGFLVEKICQKD